MGKAISGKGLLPQMYEGKPITFNEAGWFNATEAAAHFCKRPNDWLELEATKAYLTALDNMLNRNQPERFLIVMRGGRGKSDATWFHPKLAVRFAQWLDVAFAVWCDMQIDDLMRGNHPAIDWKRLRHQASASYKVLSQVLQLSLEQQGKAPARHHFSNEARLVNWALTGEFCGLDRDRLNKSELDALARLEAEDILLVARGHDYQSRKAALSDVARRICPRQALEMQPC